MVDFKALKERQNNLSSVQEAATKMNTKGEFVEDDTYWQPTRGKDGNGFAIIRFLPAPAVDGDDAVPFVKYYRHSFQGPVSGEWYIENCLTSLGKKDPVNDLTRLLYKADTEFDKKLAGIYKRKTTYVSNILVIKDDANPGAVGKIKKFRYGVKIWGKIEEAMFPKIGSPVDPFDFWKGAHFGLDVKTVGDWPNYDGSKFDIPAPLSNDDEYLEKLWRESYSLKEFLDEKNYKDYDTLKAKLDSVVSFTYEERGSALSATSSMAGYTAPAATQVMRTVAPSSAPVAPVATPKKEDDTPPWMPTPVEGGAPKVAASDDEDMAFLKKLQASAASS